MKKINKLTIFAVVISILFCNAIFIVLAKDNVVKEHFMVIIKTEYCDKTENVIDDIDCEFITFVRELTNSEDYSEAYTPMLLVFVNEDIEDSFEKAQEYFFDKEYFVEIRYDIYIGPEDFELLGDADKDGALTAVDVRFILRCAVGLEEYSEDLSEVIDMNSDNRITADDARAVLRLSVGLPS